MSHRLKPLPPRRARSRAWGSRCPKSKKETAGADSKGPSPPPVVDGPSPQPLLRLHFFVAKTLAFKSDTDIILPTLSTCQAPLCEKTMSELAELSVEPLPRSEEHTSELQSPVHLVCR